MEQYQKFRHKTFGILVLSQIAALIGGGLVWFILGSVLTAGPIVSLGVGIISGYIVTLVFAYGLYRYLVIPFKKLYDRIQQIATGNLQAQSTYSQTGVYKDLGEILNKISHRLSEVINQNQSQTTAMKSEINRLRTVLNTIEDGVIALDGNQNIILFNRAAAQITGYPEQEAMGTPINAIVPIRNRQEPTLPEWLDRVQNQDAVQKSWDNAEVATKDNQTKYYSIDAMYTANDPNGLYTLIIFHDKTAKQEVENMKVDFIALAAHELRTPVTLINGYIDILETELAPELSQEYQGFIDKLDISASQLVGIINNILRVSRIEHGDLNLKIEQVQWEEFLPEAITELQKEAETKGRQIKLEVADNLPAVAADKVSIQQVLNNLIDNAIKYTSTNGTITIKAYPSKDMVETVVSDDGVGIPANIMDKLFTKFYRSHYTKGEHKGTGLGLYISRAVVDAHGGNIWVQSTEGEGATFGFTLNQYQNVADDDNDSDNNTKITRGVHGWIKNHSLYRR